VTALSQYNSFNYWGWLEDIECLADVKVVSGDIRDPNFCREIVRGQEVVFHLAALIAIPYSYVAPDSYVDVNVRGTLNICQAARDHGVSRVVHTSTSEVYGTALYVPIDEKHPLQPQSPYSASKIGADAIAAQLLHAFDLPLTILRPFNTYGPRQSARAVIPTMIAQIASGQKEIAIGDTSPTRDFNYVEDTCRAFMLLADCDEAIGRTVNAGSNFEISIADTFDTDPPPDGLGRAAGHGRGADAAGKVGSVPLVVRQWRDPPPHRLRAEIQHRGRAEADDRLVHQSPPTSPSTRSGSTMSEDRLKGASATSRRIVDAIRGRYGGQGFIPLHAPVFGGREKEYVLDCIDSTFVSSVGAYVDRFEEMMRDLTGAAHAVAVVNGTAALHMCLVLAGVEPGDEVVTQPLTFVATCNAVAHQGASPVVR
jgi:NAD dependent epimerase/dehydratase